MKYFIQTVLDTPAEVHAYIQNPDAMCVAVLTKTRRPLRCSFRWHYEGNLCIKHYRMNEHRKAEAEASQ